MSKIKNALDKMKKQIRYYKRKNNEHEVIAIVAIENETQRKIRVLVSCGTTSSGLISM